MPRLVVICTFFTAIPPGKTTPKQFRPFLRRATAFEYFELESYAYASDTNRQARTRFLLSPRLTPPGRIFCRLAPLG